MMLKLVRLGADRVHYLMDPDTRTSELERWSIRPTVRRE
jgi:hypothetical protein